MTQSGLKSPESRGFHGIIETAPKSACNTRRGLTRSPGTSREGLPVMVPKTCAIDDCRGVHEARGWCNKHYKRWQKYGDPMRHAFAQTPEEFEARFWGNVEKTPTCWNWTGSRTSAGYGQVLKATASRVYAHRYSYELSVGPIPEGMEIDHRCHNTLCVNPDHLRPATSKQNNENFRGAQRGNPSGVRGVIWRKEDRRWSVQVGHNRKNHYGGVFDSIQDAERAAVALRLKLYTHNDVDRGVTKKLLGGKK